MKRFITTLLFALLASVALSQQTKPLIFQAAYAAVSEWDPISNTYSGYQAPIICTITFTFIGNDIYTTDRKYSSYHTDYVSFDSSVGNTFHIGWMGHDNLDQPVAIILKGAKDNTYAYLYIGYRGWGAFKYFLRPKN